MAHAMKSSLFGRRMENTIAKLAAQAVVMQVVNLPDRIQQIGARNRDKLGVCQTTLDEDQAALILTMLNEDWSQNLNDIGHLTHWCETGCCRNERQARSKIKHALQVLLLGAFETPLLYRWKHVEPAAEFTLRGLLVHRVLEHVWRCSLSQQADDPIVDQDVADLDEDNADLSPAEKQKVRATKVLQLLSRQDSVVTWRRCRIRVDV